MAETIERFPLFPLSLVLLPGEVVPLHIFEQRYKQMIDECLDDDGEFGIVWVADDGVHDIGCSAGVTQLLERMEDGRMNILVQGTRRFRLLRRIDDMAYPAGDIEPLEDSGEPPSDHEAGAEARERYADLVEAVTESRPTQSDIAELDAYGMAATLDLSLEAKQDLLELRAEDERLRRLSELFELTAQRVAYAEKASGQARSNGKVRFDRGESDEPDAPGEPTAGGS